jgi:hypothetical protein
LSRLRFLLAGLLVVVAGLAALLMAGLANSAVTASLEAATSGSAEGLTVTAHPDPYFVYSLDGTPLSSITVTGPDGNRLPVGLTATSFTYGPHRQGLQAYGPHRQGLQAGTFEVPVGRGLADYRVVATTDQAQSDVRIAVSTFDVAGLNRLTLWGIVALLLVNIGVAVAVVLLPASAERASPMPVGDGTARSGA